MLSGPSRAAVQGLSLPEPPPSGAPCPPRPLLIQLQRRHRGGSGSGLAVRGAAEQPPALLGMTSVSHLSCWASLPPLGCGAGPPISSAASSGEGRDVGATGAASSRCWGS